MTSCAALPRTEPQTHFVPGGFGGPNVQVVGQVLADMLSTHRVWNTSGEEEKIRGAISGASCSKLQELIGTVDARRTLEVGCATGVSTLAILSKLDELGGDREHIAIDPNQTSYGPDGYRGVAVEMAHRAALSDRFTLMEEMSQVALPRLWAEGRKFDLIFLDGWHSFDLTFVDYYYADLLLRDGGILVFDDAEMPPVRHVCWFLETHKDYDFLGGPARRSTMHPWYKLNRRFDPAKHTWGSIQGYRKRSSSMVPSDFFESEFYPHYRLYRWWMKLRGFPIRKPY